MKVLILDWILMPVAIIRIFTMTKEARKHSLDFMIKLKNSETFELKTIPNKLNFQTNTSTTGSQGIFNVFSDTLNYVKPTAPEYQSQSNITITFSVPGVGDDAKLFYFYVYKDGVVVNTQSYLTQVTPMYLEVPLEESGAYTFYISSTAAISFTSVYYYETGRMDGSTYVKMTDLTVTQSTTQTTTTTMDLAQYMPDITVEEFFTGILKMFNLTCYSDTAGVFKIEQLESWYENGVITHGECKVDDLNKVIILSPNFRYDSIMLEYTYVPQQDGDYQIFTCLVEAAIAFAKWKLKEGSYQEYISALTIGRRALPKKKVQLQTLNQVIRESQAFKLRS